MASATAIHVISSADISRFGATSHTGSVVLIPSIEVAKSFKYMNHDFSGNDRVSKCNIDHTNLRFAMNLAKQNGLQISSKLVRLAMIVEQGELISR